MYSLGYLKYGTLNTEEMIYSPNKEDITATGYWIDSLQQWKASKSKFEYKFYLILITLLTHSEKSSFTEIFNHLNPVFKTDFFNRKLIGLGLINAKQ